MLKTILGAMGLGSTTAIVFLIGTILPALADDQVVDLSAFSIDKITPFAPKGFNKQFNFPYPQPQPKVHLNPGDALVVKLSKMEGRSDYAPCHLCLSKTRWQELSAISCEPNERRR